MACMGKWISDNCSNNNSTVSVNTSTGNFHQHFSQILLFSPSFTSIMGSKSTLSDRHRNASNTHVRKRTKNTRLAVEAAPRDPHTAAAAAACYQVLPPTSFNMALFRSQQQYQLLAKKIPRFKPWWVGGKIEYIIRRESASSEQKKKQGGMTSV